MLMLLANELLCPVLNILMLSCQSFTVTLLWLQPVGSTASKSVSESKNKTVLEAVLSPRSCRDQG